jgi:hypothetical protein
MPSWNGRGSPRAGQYESAKEADMRQRREEDHNDKNRDSGDAQTADDDGRV